MRSTPGPADRQPRPAVHDDAPLARREDPPRPAQRADVRRVKTAPVTARSPSPNPPPPRRPPATPRGSPPPPRAPRPAVRRDIPPNEYQAAALQRARHYSAAQHRL